VAIDRPGGIIRVIQILLDIRVTVFIQVDICLKFSVIIQVFIPVKSASINIQLARVQDTVVVGVLAVSR